MYDLLLKGGLVIDPTQQLNAKRDVAVENGYIAQERSAHDRRSVKVRLTPKGLELREHIASLYDRHVDALDAAGTLAADKLGATNGMLKGLERFWSERLRLGG